MSQKLAKETIEDFGEQWSRYPENDGYFASVQLLEDACGPLLPLSALKGTRVAEIGSGAGRIVEMLLDAGASEVTAIEPSPLAFEVLQRNTAARAQQIRYLQALGEEIPPDDFDFVVSIGVLHHIPQPEPTVAAAYRALRSGGKMLIWLYGREGNEAYLRLVEPLRQITTKIPHGLLVQICNFLNFNLDIYILLCRFLPLPLQGYMNNVISQFSRQKRWLVIYDQLKPAYAKYYTQSEARELLEKAGFNDVRLHHRHKYSWTVMGTKI
jgi:SAM-dependent methyltransferase